MNMDSQRVTRDCNAQQPVTNGDRVDQLAGRTVSDAHAAAAVRGAATARDVAGGASDAHPARPMRPRKPTFAFQWHITDECDQRCKHCYLFSEDARMGASP